MLDLQTYGATIISDFLNTMKEELIAYMDSNDRNATGQSKSSIQVVNITGSTGQLIGAEWIAYVFKGRGPGKMPPIDKIIDWVNARGIPRNVAWVIARNIAESGTKLWREKRNIFNEIITEEKINTFVESIAVIYQARLNSDIGNLIKAA